jgi:hypothetical protein
VQSDTAYVDRIGYRETPPPSDTKRHPDLGVPHVGNARASVIRRLIRQLHGVTDFVTGVTDFVTRDGALSHA